jgi:glycosidase
VKWREHPIGDLYKRLLALKKENPVLWNGAWGAEMIPVPNDQPKSVISFVRGSEEDKVFAVFNLSAEAQDVGFSESLYHGEYRDYFVGDVTMLDAQARLRLEPWDFRVYVR